MKELGFFVFCIIAESSDEVRSLVTRYVEKSPLENPYIAKEFIIEAAIDHYHHRKLLGANIQTNKNTVRGRSNVVPPQHYRIFQNHDLEHNVPKWRITFEQLVDFYDRARFERYIDFSYRKCCWKCTKEKEFKRRITWLLPENGTLVVYLYIQTTPYI